MPAKSSSKPRAGQPQTRFAWVRCLPPWLSAIAAVIGTTLTAIGVFGLIQAAQPPAQTITPVVPRVTIESVLIGPQEVEAEGGFENLDPSREEVLFVGRPKESTTDRWVAVEAALSPINQAGSLQSGRWNALRPAPPPNPGYRWRAIVWPSTAGATGDEDLQLNGPDSEYVLARSEEWLEE